MKILSHFLALFILFSGPIFAIDQYYSEKDFALVKNYDTSSEGAIFPWNNFLFCGEGDIFLSTGDGIIHNKILKNNNISKEKTLNIKNIKNFKGKKSDHVRAYKCIYHKNEHIYLYGSVGDTYGVLNIKGEEIEFYESFFYWPNPGSDYSPHIVCKNIVCEYYIRKMNLGRYNIIVDNKLFDFSSRNIIEYEPFYDDNVAIKKNSLNANLEISCLNYGEIKNWIQIDVKTCPKEIVSLYNSDYIYKDGKKQIYHSQAESIYTECFYRKGCAEKEPEPNKGFFVEKYVAFGKDYHKKTRREGDLLLVDGVICSRTELVNDVCPHFALSNEVLYRFDYLDQTYLITADEMIEFRWYTGKFTLWRKKK